MGWIGDIFRSAWDTWWGWLTGLAFLPTLFALFVAAMALWAAFWVLMVIPVMVTLWRDKQRAQREKAPARPE